MEVAFPPEISISLATAELSFRSRISITAPSLARRRAAARPSPPAAPVTTATRLSKRPGIGPLPPSHSSDYHLSRPSQIYLGANLRQGRPSRINGLAHCTFAAGQREKTKWHRPLRRRP